MDKMLVLEDIGNAIAQQDLLNVLLIINVLKQKKKMINAQLKL